MQTCKIKSKWTCFFSVSDSLICLVACMCGGLVVLCVCAFGEGAILQAITVQQSETNLNNNLNEN